MGANSNAVNRVPYTRDPALEFDVYDATGWPPLILAPDGEMRSPLVEGAKYTVHNTHLFPKILWPKATSFLTFAPTEITGARLAVSLLVIGTAGIPHIWGREVGVVALNRVSAVDITNAGSGGTLTLFNLTGGTAFSQWLTYLFAPIQFKKLGNLVEIGINCENSAWSNNIQGLVQRFNPGNALFNQCETLVINGLFGPAMIKPFHSILGAPVEMIQIANPIQLKAGDTIYYIDSAVPDISNLVFSSHPYAGLSKGDFFRPDFSGTLTGMVQKDLVINSFSDSTVNPGVDTTVNLAVITKHTKGEEILIADEAAYDGLRTIVRVADDQLSFDINVVFSTSGAGTLKATQFTTSGNNPIVEAETVTVAGTTSYNTTLKTTIVGDTTFELPILFVADDATGTVTSTSKNSKSIGVLSIGNGAQSDSSSLAQANLGSQQTAVITNTNQTFASMASNGAGGTTITFAVAHGLLDRRGIEIAGTGNGVLDNSQYLIFNVTSLTMDISEPFISTFTGDVDTGSAISEPLPGTSWVQDVSTERFTVATNGRVTAIGATPFSATVSYNASVSRAGGGNQIIEGSIFFNGKKEELSASITQDSSISNISKGILKTFNPGDFVDMCFTNNDATSDIIVEANSSVMVVRNG